MRLIDPITWQTALPVSDIRQCNGSTVPTIGRVGLANDINHQSCLAGLSQNDRVAGNGFCLGDIRCARQMSCSALHVIRDRHMHLDTQLLSEQLGDGKPRPTKLVMTVLGGDILLSIKTAICRVNAFGDNTDNRMLFLKTLPDGSDKMRRLKIDFRKQHQGRSNCLR